MPHLTAAHARMQGGKNSACVCACARVRARVHPRPYGQAELASFRRSRENNFGGSVWSRFPASGGVEAAVESSKIDISDRVPEVSLFTLLNAQ